MFPPSIQQKQMSIQHLLPTLLTCINTLVHPGEALIIYHEKIFNYTITKKEHKEPNTFSLLNEQVLQILYRGNIHNLLSLN